VNAVFAALASATFIITPVIILMLVLTPFLDKRFSARGRYVVWLVLMGVMVLPFAAVTPRPVFEVHMPIAAVLPVAVETEVAPGDSPQNHGTVPYFPYLPQLGAPPRPVFEFYIPQLSEHHEFFAATVRPQLPVPVVPVYTMAAPTTYREPVQIDYGLLFIVIYGLGVMITLGMQFIQHMKLRRFVRRWSSREDCADVLDLFSFTAYKMGIKRKIGLERVKGMDSPMLMGFFKPRVLVPYGDFGYDELSFIFRHELTHYKRHDLWFKLGLEITRALHWFNPAVHFMARQANKDIEIICDMKTVDGMDIAARAHYSRLLLSMATSGQMRQSALSTYMNDGKKELKQRFANILGSRKRRGVVVFALIGLLIVSVSLMVGVNFGEVDGYPDGIAGQARNDGVGGVGGGSGVRRVAANAAELRRNTVRSSDQGETYGFMVTPVATGINLEMEITSGDIFISPFALNSTMGFQMLVSQPYRFNCYKNGSNFLITNYTNSDNSDDAYINVNITPDLVFDSIDIYVERGNVILENITVTGPINIIALDGEIIFSSVTADMSQAYFNGARAMPRLATPHLHTVSTNAHGVVRIDPICSREATRRHALSHSNAALYSGFGVLAMPTGSFTVMGWSDSMLGALYHNDLAVLRALVPSRPVLQEHNFSDITSINIHSTFAGSNVTFKQGDELSVRYYGWFENQYELLVYDGSLLILSPSNLVPLHRSELSGNHSGGSAMLYIRGGRTIAYCRDWLGRYLAERGQEANLGLIITLPPEISHIESRNLSFDVSGFEFETNIELLTRNGAITAHGAAFNAAARLETRNGDIAITNSTFASDATTIYTRNGAVSSYNNLFRMAEITTRNGGVSIEGCRFFALNVQAHNSSVNVNLPEAVGNYDVRVSQSSRHDGLRLNGELVAAAKLVNEADGVPRLSVTTNRGGVWINAPSR